MFHTLFNVVCTLIFLPLTSLFVRLSHLIIRDKKVQENKVIKMDARMLEYPSVALGQLTKEVSRMSFEAITGCSDNSLYPGGNDRFGTGRCSAVCGTWFQGHIKSCSGSFTSGSLKGIDFGMRHPAGGMITTAHDFTISDNHSTHCRIWIGMPQTFLRQFKGTAHK
jgi:hypothetical protein